MKIKRIVFFAFLVPIITVAFVSISHVTAWYGIANPLKWAMYLSIGVEVAALSALAGFSVNLGKLLYPPLILVTIIQFIGNVFYNFQFIDTNGELFKDWVDLSYPLFYFMGVEQSDIISHKRILAVLEGGFLPAISLFFMHLLIKLDDMNIGVEKPKEVVVENKNSLIMVPEPELQIELNADKLESKESDDGDEPNSEVNVPVEIEKTESYDSIDGENINNGETNTTIINNEVKKKKLYYTK